MISSKIKKMIYIPLLMIIASSYIGGYMDSYGETGENQLSVYKLSNSNNMEINLKNGEYDPSIPLSKQIEGKKEIRGISGDKVEIFIVEENEQKEDLDRKYKENKMGQAYKYAYTSEDGSAIFVNLPDGRYYIVSDSKSGYVSSSSMVDLPYRSSKKIIKNIFIYLKSVKKTPTSGNKENPKLGVKRFIKIDNSPQKRPLEGAGFKLYKMSKNNEWAVYKRDGNDYVVYSGIDGKFEFNRLEYGKYRMVETIAPNDGLYQYKKMEEPYEFEIDSEVTSDSLIAIQNVPENKIPNKTRDKNPDKEGSGKTPLIKIPNTGDLIEMSPYIFGISISLFGLILYKKTSKDKSE